MVSWNNFFFVFGGVLIRLSVCVCFCLFVCVCFCLFVCVCFFVFLCVFFLFLKSCLNMPCLEV